MIRKISLEVAALRGQQLVERGAAAGLVLGEDHLADVGDPLGIEEHVLGAAQADALGAELARGAAVVRRSRHWCGPAGGARASAQPISVPKSPTSSGWMVGTSPSITSPVDAVEGDHVAFADLAAADAHQPVRDSRSRARRRR